jgi:hypothetical protein
VRDVREPLLEFGKAGRIELVNAPLTIDTGLNELRALEDVQVLGNRWRADLEMISNLA